MNMQYLCRMGSTDGEITKTLFFSSRRQCLMALNAIAYLLWEDHVFRYSKCQDKMVRVEQEDYWLEYVPQARSETIH